MLSEVLISVVIRWSVCEEGGGGHFLIILPAGQTLKPWTMLPGEPE